MDELQSEKLEKFMVSVNGEVDTRIRSMIGDAETVRQERLNCAEDEALLEAYSRIQKSVKDIEADYRRQYALKEQSLRNGLFKFREELAERIFSGVKRKIYSFIKSDKYESYIFSLIENETAGENAIVMISENDMIFLQKLENKFGYKVMADKNIKLGGIAIIDSERGIVIDRTLDSAFEDQRKNFSSRYSFHKADGGVKR